jgi:hypothetical protein
MHAHLGQGQVLQFLSEFQLVLPCHDQYWQTETAMAEGNPVLALESGEQVELPSVLYIQGTKDLAHPRPDLDRFVANYRKVGGQVELELFEGEGQAIEKIITFVHQQAR